MLSVTAFHRLVRASAIYDVLMTAAFATPSTFLLLREQLSDLNVGLGGVPLPDFGPFHLLISSLLGSVVMVWSVLRMLDPQPRFGFSSCRNWPGAWCKACHCAPARARWEGSCTNRC
jgi:hypothetical protein